MVVAKRILPQKLSLQMSWYMLSYKEVNQQVTKKEQPIVTKAEQK